VDAAAASTDLAVGAAAALLSISPPVALGGTET